MVGLTGASSATSVAGRLHGTLAERPEEPRALIRRGADRRLERRPERGDHERADEAENDSDGASEQSLKQRLTGHLSHDEALGPAERLQRAELTHALRHRREREQAGDQECREKADDHQRLAERAGEVLRIDERS